MTQGVDRQRQETCRPRLRCGRVTGLRPWTDYPQPDSDVIFTTEAGTWLLFHTTTPERAARIVEGGFEDHTAAIGWDRRLSAHGVYFGMVPAIPCSIDYFHGDMMTADAIAWIVVEAPATAWPHQAVSHRQDSTWPLYQVCYRADQVNAWPRRCLLPCEVLVFRPLLSTGEYLESIREAVREGWLPSAILDFATEES